ncbi:MAG: quinol:cytochrome C oxidoreductase [Pirellulales bacterium]|nr:quinol:cytochrome C oxidoreductase [Pirellulales bacterium]
MREHRIPNVDDDRLTLSGTRPAVCAVLAIAGIGMLVAGLVLGWNRGDELKGFLASYLVSFCFFLSISLGALFFVALQHLVHAGWSVTVRRLAEILAANTFCMAILFLPILGPMMAGNSSLYAWSNPAAVDADELLQWKQPYLNVPFFAGRAVVYFLIWGLMARFFLANSTRQDDSGDPGLTRRMEKFSAVALILFSLTVTFAAFDWLMSLEPDWFSTIFGLYYFAGAVVAFFATLILFALALQQVGLVTQTITTEHYHELGKLLLGFIIFWGYMAFSQYMLIWYANIPEESVWYLARQTGPWTFVSLGLLLGHLLFPFFGLLPREVKRRKLLLGAWAVWMLVVHWIDLYWLVMPTFAPEHLPFGLIDVCCILGVGSLFLAGLLWSARSRALVPVKDPRLDESLAFENF